MGTGAAIATVVQGAANLGSVITLGGLRYEIFPPTVSASGRRHCRATGRNADCYDANKQSDCIAQEGHARHYFGDKKRTVPLGGPCAILKPACRQWCPICHRCR